MKDEKKKELIDKIEKIEKDLEELKVEVQTLDSQPGGGGQPQPGGGG